MNSSDFVGRVERREAVVGIVGLGYVGLPLVLAFARQGLRVIGFDVDPAKVEKLKRGESYIRHIPVEELSEHIKTARFHPTTDFGEVSRCDALLLCVPTPLNRYREPDMSYVEGTARSIAPHLCRGQLVVLESTTYPGTTDGLLREALESCSGLSATDDFLLAYSPEREDPGNPDFSTQRIPKVLGGFTKSAHEAAVALYSVVIDRVVEVSSTRVAELVKLLENIFRGVNIALVNEMKVLCDRMDIDVWEVIEAASSKPFGYMPFYPGPGLGGHCIPIDPFYLTWKAREYGLSTRFIELAGQVNTSMPQYVLDRTAGALNKQKKPLNGSKVLVLGIAYKADVDDVRESPALTIIELLQAHGAQVSYHDPFIPRTHKMREHDLDMESVMLTDATLREADAVLIITGHSTVDYEHVVQNAKLVVDTRNATKNVKNNRERIVRA